MRTSGLEETHDRVGALEPSLHVVLVGNREITDLNARFLGRNAATDVLAFDLRPSVPSAAEPCVVGEIYVSLEVAVSAAHTYSKCVGYEALLYIVHGVLHLTGEDDRAPGERRRMRRAERRIMGDLQARFNLARIFGC